MHESKSFNPFPDLIWKFQFDFDDNTIYNRVLVEDKQESYSLLEAGDAYSSVGQIQPHEWKETEDFRKWLVDPIEHVWNAYHFRPIESWIGNSWFNIHNKTGETLEHPHAHVDIVVSAYLKAPPESGNILFRDPLEYHKTNTPIVPEREIWYEVPVETGDVLLFPGWLKHKTQPNITDKERVVLTFNILS